MYDVGPDGPRPADSIVNITFTLSLASNVVVMFISVPPIVVVSFVLNVIVLTINAVVTGDGCTSFTKLKSIG